MQAKTNQRQPMNAKRKCPLLWRWAQVNSMICVVEMLGKQVSKKG